MRRIKTTVTSNGGNNMRRIKTTVTSNGGNMRWKDQLKQKRNIPMDKKHRHYYEGF